MAWKEVKGSRQVNETSQYIDYIITFQGAGSETKPSIGNKLTNIESGQTLSSTGLVAEPVAIAIQPWIDQYIGTAIDRVTVRFRGHKARN